MSVDARPAPPVHPSRQPVLVKGLSELLGLREEGRSITDLSPQVQMGIALARLGEADVLGHGAVRRGRPPSCREPPREGLPQDQPAVAMTTVSFANDIDVEYRLAAITCADCGTPFGIGRRFEQARRADQRGFYCPNGHSNYYPKPKRTEADRLREQLEAARSLAQRERDRRESAERSARAHKGVATRVKNRAAHGVCPVPGCKRSFANVAQHVAGQHPDFVPQQDGGDPA